MQEDARIKRQRMSQKNNGMIVTISPELPGRHPFNFKLSKKLMMGIITVVGLTVVGFVAISALLFRSYQGYTGMKQLNQRLNSELSLKKEALRSTELTVSEMEAAIASLIEMRTENAELAQRLRLREIELAASEQTVAQMNQSLQSLLGQLGQVDGLVQELQVMSGLEPNTNLSQLAKDVDPSTASGGELENASFEDLATGLSGLVGSAQNNLLSLSATISEVRDTVAYQQALADARPRIWPTEGYISSNFGWRKSPITGKQKIHKGMDIVAPFKTPIKVAAPGKVVRAGWSNSGYGNHVLVDHGYGMKTHYAHLNAISVSVGDKLAIGDEVGFLGNTGYSTGPHLHYEVWVNDVPTNPADYLP